MDRDQFDALSERLLEISSVIEKLPSEVRSQAFALLSSYATGRPRAGGSKSESQSESKEPDAAGAGATQPANREQFFGKFTHDKPADNVKLIAAWWFSQHGSAAFSLEALRQIATDVGLTIPERPNMTLNGAAQDGKALFKSAGRGSFEPTVHGEAYLKKTYSVTKGTQPVKDPQT